MKTLKKVLLIILGILVIVVAGFYIYVQLSWDKEFDSPYPDITATYDSVMIARGKYLAYGPAHCAECHIPMDKLDELRQGKDIPLSGGWELPIPPGIFRAPNLTPDPETGIGNLTDGQIARALRYSVNHRNRLIVPFMPFQDISDQDLSAIISFLRSQEPVKNEVKPTEFSFLGKAMIAFGLLKPKGPSKIPPKSVAIDTTVSYGEYLANSVGNCLFCHTKVSEQTGALLGPHFAGGGKFPADHFTKGYSFISPNLTPDKETGILALWDEKFFLERFHGGRLHEGSPMPWELFSRMTDTDLKALYRYFMSLEPVGNKIEKTVFEPGEELPD
ncbi:MAG: cytochrome c [Bacteroidales bacterium]|nr:cytochrome c [Bacteroidales bacterium]